MPVRPATCADLPVLEDLCEAFRAERKAGSELPYDAPMFMRSLAAAIDSDDALLLLLDEDQGFFLGVLGVTAYSTATVAHELIWYTRRQARGRGFVLFRSYLRWAREKGVEYVFMTLPEQSDAMARLGFTQADVGYFKRLPRPAS